ncbi:MAG: GGDEF domain-containing protein [Ruminococcus sp.]|nr:GGDEF domain-containing protein [Ruminococcus sp.]
MNLQAIIVANCIGSALLMILLISSRLVRQRKQTDDRIFTAMIAHTSVACIVEMISFIIDGVQFPFSKQIILLTNSYLFYANVIVSLLWTVYTDLRLYRSEERMKKYLLIRSIPAIIGIAALIPNLKWQFIFSIDENLVYHREPIGYSYYAITFGYLFYSIIIRQGYYRKYGRSKFYPISMFLAPIFIGATAQLLVYGVSLAWCSVALGLTGIYLSLQNELSYLDPLTSLYNRSYLNIVLKDIWRRRSPASGIMIDLDYFKAINDTYGHTIGDLALIEAANIIRSAAPDHAVVFRYAGDEFIVLFRTDSEEKTEELISKIRRGVEVFNLTGGQQYDLSFSIGYSMYPGSGEPTDKFLHEMDTAMYQEKRLKHRRSPAVSGTQ